MNVAWLLAHGQSDAGLVGWLADNWLGITTLGVLAVSGVVLPFTYWYIANRPNVIVGPEFERGFASVRVRNDGRTSARRVSIRCETLEVVSDPEPVHLDARLGTLHPRQELEYFVGPGHEVLRSAPYVFKVEHDRWLFRGLPRVQTTQRTFEIKFSDFRHILTTSDPVQQLTREVTDFGRTANATLKTLVARMDRRQFRYRRLKRWVKRRTASVRQRLGRDRQ